MSKKLDSSIPTLVTRTSCAEKNDKLGWKAGFAVANSYGSVGVRTNDPALMPDLKKAFLHEHFTDDVEVKSLVSVLVGRPSKRKGTQNFHILYDGWTRMVRSLDLSEVLDAYRRYATSFLLRARNQVHMPGTLVEWQGRHTLLVGDIEARQGLVASWPGQPPTARSSLVVFREDGTVSLAASPDAQVPEPAEASVKLDSVLFLGTPGFKIVSAGEAAVLLFTQGVGAGGSERLGILARAVQEANCAVVGGVDGQACWNFLRENSFALAV